MGKRRVPQLELNPSCDKKVMKTAKVFFPFITKKVFPFSSTPSSHAVQSVYIFSRRRLCARWRASRRRSCPRVCLRLILLGVAPKPFFLYGCRWLLLLPFVRGGQVLCRADQRLRPRFFFFSRQARIEGSIMGLRFFLPDK